MKHTDTQKPMDQSMGELHIAQVTREQLRLMVAKHYYRPIGVYARGAYQAPSWEQYNNRHRLYTSRPDLSGRPYP
jgi:hypothetical protein